MGVLTTLILIFFSTLLLIAVLYIKRRLLYWESKGVQTLKPIFLLGNAQSLVTANEGIGFSVLKLTEHFKRLGAPFCGFYFLIKPIFIPINAELIKRMLISDFEHFGDRPFTNHESDPLSCHIFALKGSKWKNIRNKLSPAFTKAKNKMMLPTVKACVENLLEVIDDVAADNGVAEMKDLVSRLTLDVSASTIFGLDTNGVKNADCTFAFHAREYFNPSIKDTFIRMVSVLAPDLLPMVGVNSIKSKISNFFINTVKSTIKYREAHNVIRNDLMHLLLQIKNNVKIVDTEMGEIRKTDTENDALTLNEIAAQCFVFMVAGYESSSSAVSFCLYELSLNPTLQERAREEILDAVNEHNGEVTYDVLSKVPFLECCVKETMRKYPLLPFLFRICTKTYPVPDSNVVIEKDTICLISTLGLHYDPDMYPNPEHFDPDRFTEDNIAKRHSLSWIPFGDGPRICIAFQFGLMQVKLALAMLLLNYEFSLNPKTTVPLVLDNTAIQTTPKYGIWLNVKKCNL